MAVRVVGVWIFSRRAHATSNSSVHAFWFTFWCFLGVVAAHHETLKYTTSAAITAIRPATCLTVEIVDLL